MTPQRVDCQDLRRWLRDAKVGLGVLTRADADAVQALAHLASLYAHGDSDVRRGALEAMRATVQCMQADARWLVHPALMHATDEDTADAVAHCFGVRR